MIIVGKAQFAAVGEAHQVRTGTDDTGDLVFRDFGQVRNSHGRDDLGYIHTQPTLRPDESGIAIGHDRGGLALGVEG